MRLRELAWTLATGLSVAATSLAGDTFIEGFEDGTNEAGWTWGTGAEEIVLNGGNPDAFLQDLTLATFTPIASTGLGVSSEFTGNYRQRGVIAVGIDLVVIDALHPYGNRPLTLFLYNYNDTPFDFDDDFGAFFISDTYVPGPGPANWTEFDFVVQSQATTTPPGWITFRFDGGPAGDATWNELMVEVDGIDLLYGIPGLFYQINDWRVGMDNPRITEGSSAVGACCFAQGDCEQLSEADCVSAGGVYQGGNVSCGPETCIPAGPVGACCDPETGDCLITSQELCEAFGGGYQGDDTVCEPGTCAPPVDPCGLPDAGACCQLGNNTPGCDDAECCNLVCSFDPFCCDLRWDGLCVDRASEYCALCGAPDERTMNIKQGACPAPVNLSSFGFLLTVISGDVDFDVTEIDLGSLELRKCTQFSSPSIFPASEFTQVLDLHHPIEEQVFCNSCACDNQQSSDGIPDLKLMFATGGLNLLVSPDDRQVTLELRGRMTDGTEFRGRDCVVIVPPSQVVPGNVSVQSNVDQALIEASPPDRNFDSGGFANFQLAYLPGTPVTFTAPALQGSRPFHHWIIDGVAQPAGQRIVTLQVSNQTVVRAIYLDPLPALRRTAATAH